MRPTSSLTLRQHRMSGNTWDTSQPGERRCDSHALDAANGSNNQHKPGKRRRHGDNQGDQKKDQYACHRAGDTQPPTRQLKGFRSTVR